MLRLTAHDGKQYDYTKKFKRFQKASWFEEDVSPKPIFIQELKSKYSGHAQVAEGLMLLQEEFYDMYEILLPTILAFTRQGILTCHLHAVFKICRIQDTFHAGGRICRRCTKQYEYLFVWCSLSRKHSYYLANM